MDSAVSVSAEKLSHKEVFLPMKRSARMAAFLLAAALSAAPCMAEFTPVEVPQATTPLLRQKRWKMSRKSPKKG